MDAVEFCAKSMRAGFLQFVGNSCCGIDSMNILSNSNHLSPSLQKFIRCCVLSMRPIAQDLIGIVALWVAYGGVYFVINDPWLGQDLPAVALSIERVFFWIVVVAVDCISC